MDNWDLIGHEWAVDLLRRQVARGEARHAYLFTGPPGLGRRTLAFRFARAFNCPTPRAAGEPCGACRDCRMFDAMKHPDLLVVQAEREGDVLKVDQVREARKLLMLTPVQARHRMALFLRFHEANESAANALLKILEEPPPRAVLLLTADHAEQLPETIVSRCEVLRLRPLPVAQVEQFLLARGHPAETARLLAHISDGRPGYALRLAADPEALAERSARLDDLLRLLGASRVERFAYADALAKETKDKEVKDKEALRRALLIWLSFWRDVLLRASGATVELTNVDRQAAIDSQAGRLSLEQARQRVAAHRHALEQLDANVNARLLTEALLLDL